MVTIHNPNVTSAAEVLALAEFERQFNSLHAKLAKRKDASVALFPRVKTVWDCSQ